MSRGELAAGRNLRPTRGVTAASKLATPHCRAARVEVIRQAHPLSVEFTRRVFGELLAGLAAAHDAGLIHRDIKPSNILMDGPGRQVKLADFGLARVLDGQTILTQHGAVLGTPAYMSPEQALGLENIDCRTDLYSAGVVLYEMLTGRTSFKAETPSAVIHKILHEAPAEPRKLTANADPALASLARRLMEKQREDRFMSAREAQSALAADCNVSSPGLRRKRMRVAAFALAAAALLCGVLWVFGGRPRVIQAENNVDVDNIVNIVLAGRADPVPLVLPEGCTVNAATAVDALGDGQCTVVVATNPTGEDGAALLAFDGDCSELWQMPLICETEWPDCVTRARQWSAASVVAFDLDDVPGEELVVAANHPHEYPARVSVVDPRTREIRQTFWHCGQIVGLLLVDDLLGEGRPGVVVCGVDNKLDGAGDPVPKDYAGPRFTEYPVVPFVAVLDPLRMTGLGPSAWDVAPFESCEQHAYAFLDMAASYDRFYREGEDERRSAEDWEICTISAIRLASASEKKHGALLEVVTDAGVRLLLDENLVLQHVDLLNQDTEEHDDSEFWKSRWKNLAMWTDEPTP